MTLQKQYNAKHKAYMNGTLTHNEFFCWLADSIGITAHDMPVTISSIRESQDPHLNNISLKLWDNKDPQVRHKAAVAGMLSWSLSNTVCVLKCYAQREAQKV